MPYGELSCQVCDASCTQVSGSTSYCGDGELQSEHEACDDGNTIDTDACTEQCVVAICGDGITRTDLSYGDIGFEACDDGADNSDTEADACRTTCARPKCGDGVVDRVEVCDHDDPRQCAWPCGLHMMDMDASTEHTCAAIAQAGFNPDVIEIGMTRMQVVSTEIVCWGEEQGSNVPIEVNQNNFDSTVLGAGFSCAYHAERLGSSCGLAQGTAPSSEASSIPDPLMCWGAGFDADVINASYSMVCDWANPAHPLSAQVWIGQAFESTVVGAHHICSLIETIEHHQVDVSFGSYSINQLPFDVQCWPIAPTDENDADEWDFGQATPPDNITATAIAAGSYHTCSTHVAVPLGECPCNEDQICCPTNQACVHSEDLCPKTECWGRNEVGQATPPEDAVFTELTAGQAHTCGLTAEGTVVCWGAGQNTDDCTPHCGQSAPPEDFSFRSIDAGDFHTCGITEAGHVMCWGAGVIDEGPGLDGNNIHRGQSNTPNREFLLVSAGARHTCGITAEMDFLCWGSNDSGQLEAPDYWEWAENL